MDILFQSIHVRTKEFYKELYFYYYFRRPIWIMIHVLAGIQVLYIVASLLMLGEIQGINLAYIFIYVFFLLVRYKAMVDVTYKREMEVSAGVPFEYTTEVTEHALIQKSSNGSNIEIEFQKVKRVMETKSYFLLFTKTNLIFMINKDNFSIGDADGFVEYLKRKGYKVKSRKNK